MASAAVFVLPALAAQQEAPPGAEQQDAVVATVGTRSVRSSDLLAEINRQIPMVSFHRNVSAEKLREIRRDALDELVERSMIHQDALHRRIEVSDDELRATLRDALAKAPAYKDISEERFDALLDQYRSKLERRILLDKNEERFRQSLPEVSEEALEAAYQKLCESSPETVLTPEEAHIQQIFLAVDPSSADEVIEEARARADEARVKLVEGAPFAEIAKVYSEGDYAEKGGDMGIVRKEDIRSGILREAAFSLEEGALSEVVKSLYGFHIVRCVRILPRRELSIDEVRPTLETWWKEAHRKQARESWLSELRERYPVQIAPAEQEMRKDPAEGDASGGEKKGDHESAGGEHGTVEGHGSGR